MIAPTTSTIPKNFLMIEFIVMSLLLSVMLCLLFTLHAIRNKQNETVEVARNYDSDMMLDRKRGKSIGRNCKEAEARLRPL
jgi:uncharacterized membrane protein YqiK